jgi:hypothetical protein
MAFSLSGVRIVSIVGAMSRYSLGTRWYGTTGFHPANSSLMSAVACASSKSPTIAIWAGLAPKELAVEALHVLELCRLHVRQRLLEARGVAPSPRG